MKPLFYLIISGMVMSGCRYQSDIDSDNINKFVRTHKKPIVVKQTKRNQYNFSNITLIDADGQVLTLGESIVILPDTIK